jgi:transposase-like protein
MTISLGGRLTLRELMEQACQQVEGQARTMLKGAVERSLQAERDRRVAEAKRRGERMYRWGYTVIGLLEPYERPGLDEVLFAFTVGGLSQRKVVGWVRRFLGRTLSPVTIGAVLEQAQQQVAQRRSAPIPAPRYRAVVVDGIYLSYRRSVSCAPRKGVLLVAVGCAKEADSTYWTGEEHLRKPRKTTKSCSPSCGGESGVRGVDRERWTAGGGQRGADGVSRGAASPVLGALVP